MSKDKKIVAFLQNTWLKSLVVSDEIKELLFSEDDRSVRFRRKLLAQSRTGRSLLRNLGENFKNVVWCNASTEISNEPGVNTEPDINHIRRIIEHHDPDLVLGFGKVAEEGISKVMEVNGLTGKFQHEFFPHPAAHGTGNVACQSAAHIVDAFLKIINDKSTKYFYDTEFIERGPDFPIIFVSIGIVSEDGREYYAINRKFQKYINRENSKLEFIEDHGNNIWLWDNVISKLEDDPKYYKSQEQIAREIVQFVGQRPDFWAYYSDYDHVVLCQLYGRMIDLPDTWPMYTRDIKQLCDSLGNPKLPTIGKGEHNALADARWNRIAYKFLQDT